MRLLFVADGRSPIALNWMRYFVEQGHEVHLASTFACDPGLSFASLHIIPVALSSAKSGGQGTGDQGVGKLLWGASLVGLRTAFKQWVGPLTLWKAAHRLRMIIDRVQPDLVHAMRIPYEGMLAALANPAVNPAVKPAANSAAPLLISVWGNDFTLHAPATPLMKHYTRLALQRCDGLHTDCARDIRLARAWGFPDGRAAVVLPGGGGVQMDIFYPPVVGKGEQRSQGEGSFRVVNPRGFRAYVRNDIFFQAIPEVLACLPQVRFICPGMAGEPQAERWLDELGIRDQVELLPRQTRPQLAELFRRAQVAVSLTTHDGTPNTLLEAMACGCYPVVGDLESLREWITPGVNGLLVEPAGPHGLAEAILLALQRPELRIQASEHNLALVAEHAEHGKVMRAAENFYTSLIG